MHSSISLILLFCLMVYGDSSVPCNLLTTNYGTVCVCNATYCDTAPNVDVPEGSFQFITTSRDNLGFHSTTGTLLKKSQNTTNTLNIIPNPHQTILGFGGAFTDSTGYNIQSLSNETQKNLLESYFGKNGIQYSMGRVPVGGTDFSLREYAYDPVEGDVELNNFTLQEEDYNYKINFIKKAKELTNDDLKLFASAWTAPIWMKTNNDWSGIGVLKEEYYQVWADYYIRFFEEYQKEGVEFWGVTTQNEPIDGFIPKFLSKINCMGWLPQSMNKWIQENFGPTIRNSQFKDLKIIAHDDSRVTLPLLHLQLENDETMKYVDGVASHWYEDWLLPSSFLNMTKSSKKDVFLLLTEACNGFLRAFHLEEAVELGSWNRGEKYIKSVLEYLTWGAGGWVDWNMVLDMNGGPMVIDNNVDAPVIVNAENDEFYRQPMFYSLGHFSKYVRPNSIVIEADLDEPIEKLQTVAFIRPDNVTVVIIFNEAESAVDLDVQLNEKVASVTIGAQSINTLLM